MLVSRLNTIMSVYTKINKNSNKNSFQYLSLQNRKYSQAIVMMEKSVPNFLNGTEILLGSFGSSNWSVTQEYLI